MKLWEITPQIKWKTNQNNQNNKLIEKQTTLLSVFVSAWAAAL